MQDVRALLRVLGEVHELGRAGHGAIDHFLRGLATIAGADVAIVMEAGDLHPRRAPRIDSAADFGWPCASDRRLVYDHLARGPLERDPLAGVVVRSRCRLVTASLADATTGRERQGCEIASEVHRPAALGDSLLSIKRERKGRARVVVLKRGLRRPCFGARERSLINLLQRECAWVLEVPRSPKPDAIQLRPRERDMLARLATGASEKQIAAAMGISPHTAHDYVKAIYKKLGVGSRAELMASRFVLGRDQR